jgi:hypothetical protein
MVAVEILAREKATIEDGTGNDFSVGESSSLRVGVIRLIGRDEDVSDAARQITRKSARACLVPSATAVKRPWERCSIKRCMRSHRSAS